MVVAAIRQVFSQPNHAVATQVWWQVADPWSKFERIVVTPAGENKRGVDCDPTKSSAAAKLKHYRHFRHTSAAHS